MYPVYSEAYFGHKSTGLAVVIKTFCCCYLFAIDVKSKMGKRKKYRYKDRLKCFATKRSISFLQQMGSNRRSLIFCLPIHDWYLPIQSIENLKIRGSSNFHWKTPLFFQIGLIESEESAEFQVTTNTTCNGIKMQKEYKILTRGLQ